MTQTEWSLQGEWLKSCSCAFGCPCDFNARPTQGECRGFLGMRIEKGHFGATALNDLSFFAVVHFPGPLHEGHGTVQPILDERASPEQRDALFQIMSGKHSQEGTLFHIVSLITETFLEPIFAPISFSFDRDARTARLSIPGVLETETQPIRNPVTGQPHRIQVTMPEGFEHIMAEVASARISSTGGIRFEVPEGHSSLALIQQTPAGVREYERGRAAA
ncbi:MAG TPA: DUF1326 domain-containing protein [Azospirillum sp.]|nr:DUF1326 domain-containing protein [Azospirillum sp.]